MTGIAAGFGGVFGTPLAGAIFALEVIAIGRISHESLVPCLLASVVGDWSCAAWGVHHTDYHQVIRHAPAHRLAPARQGRRRVGRVRSGEPAVRGDGTWRDSDCSSGTFPGRSLRPAVGGLIIIALVYALGTRDYLGLGVHAPPGEPNGVSILSSFQPDGAHPF